MGIYHCWLVQMHPMKFRKYEMFCEFVQVFQSIAMGLTIV